MPSVFRSRALERATEANFLFDRSGAIIASNDQFKTLIGIPSISDKQYARTLANFLRSNPGIMELLRTAASKRRLVSRKVLLRLALKELGWYRVSMAPAFGRDGKGKADRFLVTFTPSSWQKTALRLEAGLASVLNQVQAGIIIHDRRGAVRSANSKACELLGFDPAEVVDGGADDIRWKFMRPDGSPMSRSELPLFRAIEAKEAVHDIIVGHRHPSRQTTIWSQCNAFPFLDPHGEVEAVIVSFTEVTKLVEKEAEAEAYRQRFELAAKASQDAIFDWDLETGAYIANDGFQEVFGWPAPVVFSLEDYRAGHGVRGPLLAVRDATVAAIDGGQERFFIEYDIDRRDGRHVFLVQRAYIIRDNDGKATRVIGTVTDVSQLTNALRALEKSETRFRIIANSLGDVLWDRDIEAGTFWITPDWPSKISLNIEEFGFDIGRLMTLIVPDDRDRVMAVMEHAYETGADRWECDFKVQSADHAAVDLRMQASVLYDTEGQPARVLGNLRDVTAENRRNDGFTRARALEAVGQLTGGVAHDFNNLLMIIQGNAELLQLSQLDQDDAESVDLIMKASEAAESLTRRLLSFSGQSTLNTARLDLSQLLADVVRLLRSGLTERITLSLTVPPDLWLVEVDGRALEQAIINLAVNASDAMGRGGGAITISCKNVTVNSHMVGRSYELADGSFVCISVSDNGCGMSDEVIAKAFEPFFTTKEVGKGTGLGLSSVYGFAKQSGGAVTVYSEPGHGTTVDLYLPVAHGEGTENTEVEVVAERPRAENARILVVEDQPDVRSHVERLLTRAGFSVVGAGDAEAALALLEQDDAFDLLFTDVIMPGELNGVQLAEKVKRMAPHIRVLLTSGFPASAFDALGIDERAELELLKKPYKSRELMDAVAKLLGN
ncbi:MAG: PAS domain-containing protein [Porphyrobacter sp.]|nr:PAS domain-containing protein [Porphyrobacter sp.]